MIEIIPKPRKFTQNENSKFRFSLTKKIDFFYKWEIDEKEKWEHYRTFSLISKELNIFLIELDDKKNISDNTTCIELIKNDKLKPGEYKITISQMHKISIEFSDKSGFCYGMASICQIHLQEEFFVSLELHDYPQLNWRGYLLDISRHFFNDINIRKTLFYNFLYKQNVLHLHLTDDQGWRMEIKKYRRLTEFGSVRSLGESTNDYYGGFLTQDEIKSIVKYANELSIEVVPEIGMPGHAQSVISSYPNLMCKGKKPTGVWNKWGVSKEVICLSNPKSSELFKNILKEVFDVFSSKYVHIGGDECPPDNWKVCENCQSYMNEKNYKSEYELQKEFMMDINDFLQKNNKQMICWDDLVEHERIDNVVVAWWRDWTLNNSEGKDLYNWVETNQIPMLANFNSSTYFDFAQHYGEITKGKMNSNWIMTLEDSYKYDPHMFTNKNPDHIMGGECSFWSERIKSFDDLMYRMFPRILAFSEVLWGTKTNYHDFLLRAKTNSKILNKLSINWCKEELL